MPVHQGNGQSLLAAAGVRPGTGPPAPGAPAAGPPAPGMPAPGAQPAGGGDIDERQLAQFSDMAYQLIYGGKTKDGEANPTVVKMLRTGGQPQPGQPQPGQPPQAGTPETAGPGGPVDALAYSAAAIGARVAEAGAANDGAVVFLGTMDVVGELASVAALEGIYDYSQEEIDAAAPKAAELLYSMTANSGLWNQQEIEQEFAGLVEADAAGSLERDLSEVAAIAGPSGQPPQVTAPMPPAGRGMAS